MDNKETVHASALDKAITTNNILMLKTMIPYVSGDKQKFISVYVKYLELMNTISYFGSNKIPYSTTDETPAHLDLFDLLSEIKPFLSRRDQDLVDSFANMAQVMKMYDSYKDIFNPGGGDEESSGPFDALKGMLSPEQQAMFDMYQNMF